MEENKVQALMDELKLELPYNHLLQNENSELIARKTNNDDIILELDNGTITVIHLTWKSKKEMKGYPVTRIYNSKIDFWNKEMKLDILEFKE